MISVEARVGLIQRCLPNYRAPFFNLLGSVCRGGLSVTSGNLRPDEAIETCSSLAQAQLTLLKNAYFLKGSLMLCWQQGILHWLASWDPDVLIVEANPRILSTRQAVTWMRKRRRSVIGWGLGSPAPVGAGKALRLLSRQSLLKQFDALITYSQQGKEEYAAAGFDPGRIFIAHNAVEARPQHPAQLRPPQYVDGKAVVLYVGRLQERKRLDVLMQACAALPQPLQPHLWIVGDGPAKDRLQSLAQNVYPTTRFYGALFGEQLKPVFEAADLFVLPGTGGLAVQQAMSHALPVVVAEADGTQSDLVRPQNGFLNPPGDVQQLTTTLQNALADPAKLRKMGQESFRIVSEEINLENMVQGFADAICAVLENSTCTS